MNVLVTGASGFIGRSIVDRLARSGHRAVPLNRSSGATAVGPWWDPPFGRVQLQQAGPLDAVIHLAGESIAQRWTPATKSRIRSSRVTGTRLLCDALCQLAQPPRVLLCASATGFYGDRGDILLDEHSPAGTGFLAETCQAWEAASQTAVERGLRVVHLRLGIVLSSQGGALAKMLPVFRLGLGGRLGHGRQYWSWIAMEDLLRVVDTVLLDERFEGPVNAVAPQATTNASFTAALARTLGRPALLPVPGFAVRTVFGEMGSEALLASARVMPARLLECGFNFSFPTIEAALAASCRRSEPR